jgi:hypothetical protein
MLGHLRATLTGSVLFSAAFVASPPSIGTAVAAGFSSPRVVMAPRLAPRLPARPLIGPHGLRRGAFLRRFHARRPVLGIDPGVGAYPVPVPVPTGGGDPQAGGVPAGDAPAYPGDYRGGYRAPAATPSGPQIIVLPDPPRRRGRSEAPERRSERIAPVYAPSAHLPARLAHRRHRWSYAGFAPRYAYPSYAYEPSPVALVPCTDAVHAPIYNTPCGLGPFPY